MIVRGPNEDVTVRRKERVAGIWINRAAVTFEDVPGFYFVASTRKLEDIVSEPMLHREEIGTERLSLTRYEAQLDNLTEAEIDDFRKAIIRQREISHLFGQADGGVLLQDNTLFSMRVDIPANVPVGDYVAKVMLVRDGQVIGSKSLFPSVNKTGIERMIYRFAHGSPFFYGVTAVLMAVLAGWAASAIFRRR